MRDPHREREQKRRLRKRQIVTKPKPPATRSTGDNDKQTLGYKEQCPYTLCHFNSSQPPKTCSKVN
jgi:hypothetical protein